MLKVHSLLRNPRYSAARYQYIENLVARIQERYNKRDIDRLYFMYQPLVKSIETRVRGLFSSADDMREHIYVEFCLLLTKYKPERGLYITAFFRQRLAHRVKQAQDSYNRGVTKGSFALGDMEVEDSEHTADAGGEDELQYRFDVVTFLRKRMDEFRIHVVILVLFYKFDQVEVARMMGVTQARISYVVGEAKKLLMEFLGERHASVSSKKRSRKDKGLSRKKQPRKR